MNFALVADEDFLGVRHVARDSYSPQAYFYCYYLSAGTQPLFLYEQGTNGNFTRGQYFRQVTLNSSNGSTVKVFDESEELYYVMNNSSNSSNPTLGKSYRVVTVLESSVEQAFFSAQHNSTFSTKLTSGKIQLARPYCASLTCANCKSGFVSDPNIGSCRACPPGCTRCNS